ncbi:unnamed protein product [Mytilus coruscus]|uniref:Uncharacterized protein n=1 Tax=Mytilus coruscus TaxID=42192 RepID=A0A6J8CLK6_MYTCO|nr:unnamed protein product [Mytilus coruscus]
MKDIEETVKSKQFVSDALEANMKDLEVNLKSQIANLERNLTDQLTEYNDIKVGKIDEGNGVSEKIKWEDRFLQRLEFVCKWIWKFSGRILVSCKLSISHKCLDTVRLGHSHVPNAHLKVNTPNHVASPQLAEYGATVMNLLVSARRLRATGTRPIKGDQPMIQTMIRLVISMSIVAVHHIRTDKPSITS